MELYGVVVVGLVGSFMSVSAVGWLHCAGAEWRTTATGGKKK